MKAVVWSRYGPPDVLQLREVDTPVPKDDEVLIRILATTVTAGDCEVRRMQVAILVRPIMRLVVGLLRPKRITVLGSEIAGLVEAVGRDVVSFGVGDKVFGSSGFNMGTNAEYICLKAVPSDTDGGVTIMPANMTFEQAATVPFGGRDALHFLRKADIQPGQSVLINGAGGSIGTFAVQLAKLWGAEVTSVDSAEKLDMLASLGSDEVIDFAVEDFDESGKTYDVIFDVVGKASYSRSLRALNEGGFLLLANPGPWSMIRGLLKPRQGSKTVVAQPAAGTIDDLVYLRELVESGKLVTVIDRAYPLEQTADAHRYVETGKKQGNVVITIDDAV